MNYIWLFPILFIFHDLEEIIGFGPWYKRNAKVIRERFPKVFMRYEKMFTDYSTEGMALAVLEIFVLSIFVCIITELFSVQWLWSGFFIGFLLHLVIHVIQSVIIRRYIPALATSVICIPICIIILWKVLSVYNCNAVTLIFSTLLALVIIFINLNFSHFLMHQYTKWLISLEKNNKN